jgi:PqqD family protein of HPr-rel-A system
METPFAGVWRLVQPALCHQWDGEQLVVVFQPASGDTHLVDALSAEVLRLLTPTPQTAASVWQRLLERSGLSAEEFPLARLQTVLAQLEQLDLIERVPA